MNLTRIFQVGFLFLLTLTFVTCKKVETISSTKELTSFKFEQSRNIEALREDYVGTSDGLTYTFEVPYGTPIDNLVATFTATGMLVEVNGEIQESGFTAQDYSQDVLFRVVAEDGSTATYTIVVNVQEKEEEPEQKVTVVPRFMINTDDKSVDERLDPGNKKTKFPADFLIDGKGQFEDFDGRMTIRGRGNSTWGMPKKPYKIKLDNAAALFGLPASKKWILLNEYLDGAMLNNSVPFKMGELLGVPYVHHPVLVELVLNGKDLGLYAFMEEKEVAENRIEVGEGGLLLEMDSYYDEVWKFRSPNYNLPVMVQYPEEEDMDQEQLNTIRSEFNQFESLVYASTFPDNNYLDYFDDVSFVNYFLVYLLTGNEEINHPKSTYINRPENTQKYRMGILWDFDWTYGYEGTSRHYQLGTANRDLFWSGSPQPGVGTFFFSRFLEDPHMVSLLRERWNWFKAEKMDELKEHVQDYGELVRQVYDKDHSIWGKRDSSGNFDTDFSNFMNWLNARIDYIDGYLAGL